MKNQSVNNILSHGKSRQWTPWKSNKRKKVRLKQYLQKFLIRIEPTLHPNTFKDYSQVIQTHIVPHIGTIKLKDLNPDHIQMLYSIKLENGTTPTRVRFIHKILKRALNLAVRWDHIERNPANFVTIPQKIHREMKTFSVKEVKIFLNAIEGSRLDALFHLAVTSGLRKSEILGLKWADLDLNTGHLRIQRQLQRIHGQGLIFSEPKSISGRRLIIIGATTLKKLKEHKNSHDIERQGYAEEWQELDLIFTMPKGSPIGPRYLYRKFKSVINDAGLPQIRFHDLRHTSATMMLRCGVHPKIVQERLGHSSIRITLDIYSHVLPVMQLEAASKIDELLTRNAETVK